VNLFAIMASMLWGSEGVWGLADAHPPPLATRADMNCLTGRSGPALRPGPQPWWPSARLRRWPIRL